MRKISFLIMLLLASVALTGCNSDFADYVLGKEDEKEEVQCPKGWECETDDPSDDKPTDDEPGDDVPDDDDEPSDEEDDSNTPPMISYNGEPIVVYEGESLELKPLITVVDDKTPPEEIIVSVDIRSTHSLEPGLHNVTYTAYDADGNKREFVLTVTVVEAGGIIVLKDNLRIIQDTSPEDLQFLLENLAFYDGDIEETPYEIEIVYNEFDIQKFPGTHEVLYKLTNGSTVLKSKGISVAVVSPETYFNDAIEQQERVQFTAETSIQTIKSPSAYTIDEVTIDISWSKIDNTRSIYFDIFEVRETYTQRDVGRNTNYYKRSITGDGENYTCYREDGPIPMSYTCEEKEIVEVEMSHLDLMIYLLTYERLDSTALKFEYEYSIDRASLVEARETGLLEGDIEYLITASGAFENELHSLTVDYTFDPSSKKGYRILMDYQADGENGDSQAYYERCKIDTEK